MAGEKTEKATPKKLDDARKKGQVARSVDLNGAIVLLAGLMAMSAFAPAIVREIQISFRHALALVATPDVVSVEGIGELAGAVGRSVVLASLPLLAVCTVAGVLANLVQVGFKPSPEALHPKLSKLNPLTGAKNLFGTRAIFETGKSIVKVVAVGAVAILTLLPQLQELGGLVGMEPAALLPKLATTALQIAQRVAMAYLVVAMADYAYQKWKFGRDMRMEKQEVKDEGKQAELPPEVKGAQRRRAREMAQARMMDAVPTADVVVTNPTHYAVALRYSADRPAPVVVAKGVDHLAFKIRARAAEAGVMIVPDPPLARSVYGLVDVGQSIPEELYQAVAQLLAYVYRVDARQAVAA